MLFLNQLSVIFVQYHPIVVWYLVAYQQMNLLKLLSEEKCGQNGLKTDNNFYEAIITQYNAVAVLFF